MPVQLYDLPHSPFCIPIRRILDAASTPYERIDVPNWDRRKVIEATHGRCYQVPVIAHDGTVVFESSPDSQDVARHVDAQFCGGMLFPAEHAGLQDILISYLENDVEGATFKVTDSFYVDSIPDLVNRVMVIRHKERKFGAGCVEQWKRERESLRRAAEAHFARFNAMLAASPFLLGDRPVFADFLLYGIIGNYTWNNWNEIPPSMADLTRWVERIEAFRFR